jgi:hypothetical protein
MKITQNRAIGATIIGVGLGLTGLAFQRQAIRVMAAVTGTLVTAGAWTAYFNRRTDRYFDTESDREWFVLNGPAEDLRPHFKQLTCDEFRKIVADRGDMLAQAQEPKGEFLVQMAGDRHQIEGRPPTATAKWAFGELFRREGVTSEERIEGLRTFLAKEDGLTESCAIKQGDYQDLKQTVMSLSEEGYLAHEPLGYLSKEVGDAVRDFCLKQWMVVWEDFKPGESEVASPWELEKMVELGCLGDADLVKMAAPWKEGKTHRRDSDIWALDLLFGKEDVSIDHLTEAMQNLVLFGDKVRDKKRLLSDAAGVIETFVKLRKPDLDDAEVKALIRLPLSLGAKESYLDVVYFDDRDLRQKFKALFEDQSGE